MSKYISIKIVNKDCKGMFLFADDDIKEISSVKEANYTTPNNQDNFLKFLIHL